MVEAATVVVVCCASDHADAIAAVDLLAGRGRDVRLLDGVDLDPRALASVLTELHSEGLYVLVRGGGLARDKLDALREVLLAHRVPFARTLTVAAATADELVDRIESGFKKLGAPANEGPSIAGPTKVRRSTVPFTGATTNKPAAPARAFAPASIAVAPPARAEAPRDAPRATTPSANAVTPIAARSDNAAQTLSIDEAETRVDSVVATIDSVVSAIEVDAELLEDSVANGSCPSDDELDLSAPIDLAGVLDGIGEAPDPIVPKGRVVTLVAATVPVEAFGDEIELSLQDGQMIDAPDPGDRGQPEPVDRTVVSPIDRTVVSPIDPTVVSPIDRTVVSPVDRTLVSPGPPDVVTRPVAAGNVPASAPTESAPAPAVAVRTKAAPTGAGKRWLGGVALSLAGIGVLSVIAWRQRGTADLASIEPARAAAIAQPSAPAAELEAGRSDASRPSSASGSAPEPGPAPPVTPAAGTPDNAAGPPATAPVTDGQREPNPDANGDKSAASSKPETPPLASPTIPPPTRQPKAGRVAAPNAAEPPATTRVQAALRARTIRALDILLVARKIAGPMSFANATSHCAGLEIDGIGNWRLPELGELASLSDAGMIGDGAFWSRTSADTFGDSHMAWSARTRQGAQRFKAAAVLCVRGDRDSP